jgi:hypothetical protein
MTPRQKQSQSWSWRDFAERNGVGCGGETDHSRPHVKLELVRSDQKTARTRPANEKKDRWTVRLSQMPLARPHRCQTVSKRRCLRPCCGVGKGDVANLAGWGEW